MDEHRELIARLRELVAGTTGTSTPIDPIWVGGKLYPATLVTPGRSMGVEVRTLRAAADALEALQARCQRLIEAADAATTASATNRQGLAR